MKQILVVRAIIKDNQKILLLRRSSGNPDHVGLYELPGGKVAFGEDPKATLQREVFEETGCELETLQLFEVHSYIDVHSPDQQYIILVFMAAFAHKSKLRVSQEHDHYAWKDSANMQLEQLTDMTRLILGIDAPQLPSINTNQEPLSLTHAIIYADGGSRGNPGPSASGFVLLDSNETLIFEGGKYLGITTNNQAEYQSVKLGLEKALELGVKTISFRLDSQLVVNQLNGIYRIKNRDLWPIYTYIKDLTQKFDRVTFTHIRREFNKAADAMVNKILDTYK